jgi:hypothetical protein
VIGARDVDDRFVDDLKASLSAWRKEPLLPTLTTVLAIVSTPSVLRPLFGKWAAIVDLPIGLLLLGWFGTQFTWYQRTFGGERLGPNELIPLTWSFVARYCCLYFLALIPVVPLFLVLVIQWHALADLLSPSGYVGLLAYLLILQIVSTFMAPALAFSTRKVRQAIPIGLSMLVGGWPRNWAYVAVPAMFGVGFSGISWLAPPAVRSLLGVIVVLPLLAFAGAVARYYLRKTTADRT